MTDDKLPRRGVDGLSRRELLGCALTAPLLAAWPASAPQTLTVTLPRPARVTDFWSGEWRGPLASIAIEDMPPHSAKLIVCE